MHILFLTHYYPPESNAPANRTFEHAKHWVKSGNKVSVITCNPNHPNGKLFPGYSNSLFKTEAAHGITIHRVWTFLAANAGSIKRIINFLVYMTLAVVRGIFVKQPDIIIATSPQFFCGLAGMLLKTIRRKPFVLEIRDIWPQSILTVGAMKPGIHIRMLEWLEKSMYRSADSIITVGEGYKNELLKRGVNNNKITVIPNGIDFHVLDNDSNQSESIRSSLHINDEFLCVYIGTVGMAHGLEIVLRAAALALSQQRHNLRFLIVGDGAERESLEKLSKEMAVSDIVQFTGRVERTQVSSYLQAADCVLVHLRKTPLFETVLPSKLFEPMAFSKPILLGVDGEAHALLRESGAGLFFEPEDEKAFLEALTQLELLTDKGASYGKNGYDFVKRRYNREDFAEEYLTVLCSLLR